MTTLIFGATGGIGRALANALAAAGHDLLLSGRRVEVLGALAAELSARALPAELADPAAVTAVFAEAGTLDLLIYAAGSVRVAPVLQAGDEIWTANYFGALWALRSGLPRLVPGGRAYLFGARPELIAARGFSQYAASKAALASLAKVAALERHPVCLVLPPAVGTPLWGAVGRPPRGALSPEQVAAAILDDLGQECKPELRIG
jgi:NAD(P)-dependent dehydrogenase (short-subunit alcohol dehydrogenase family)